MSAEMEQHIARRRTFAIISHPDAGKTTLTEKLLLLGGAIHLAGSIKARKAKKFATSDWMELERERGISVTSSVLQFSYRGFAVNLLDTPGHQDFSEDTYRTLSAADAAVMLLDAAKGVEPQTIKLFQVCKLRGIPVFTFVNKLDRYGRPPLELMDEVEKVLGIACCPMNWPLGSGPEFRGVYDMRQKNLIVFRDNIFRDNKGGEPPIGERAVSLEEAEGEGLLCEGERDSLLEEVALLEGGGELFSAQAVREAKLSPLYFGSAMTQFGLRPFLDSFLELAPAPTGRHSTQGWIEPSREGFSGFVFKIQANMDPSHRDRMAFVRVVSGKYEKGMQVFCPRLQKEIRLANPSQLLAQERTAVEEAWPGDVLGFYDPGIWHIGDALVEGGDFSFEELPRFSPEHFVGVRAQNPLRRKQVEKGLEQLSEEGTVQVFERWRMGMKDPIVGVVGELQLEVLKFRMQHEYGADIVLERLNFSRARWVVGEKFEPSVFDWEGNRQTVQDRAGRPLVLFRDEWALEHAQNQHPELVFLPHAPMGAL
ncbi:MAG: peptide chain release factor 3 [Proteobacteria bacterium]|nr:peptide chain release factor 3 [Cystobacterineae bacterium]MCL2259077.1 peptide chain release factor 3 [Cystobacterineae bacterium]MCL2314821.1 peptide chain release factor 3 [Pseudomonadota bacterium]